MEFAGELHAVPALSGPPLELRMEEDVVKVRVLWGPFGFSTCVELHDLAAAVAALAGE